MCLLHELRLVTAKQLQEFINPVIPITEKTIRRRLTLMNENELTNYFISDKDSKTRIHYLEREGHQAIRGYYPLVKSPKYNWYHCLMINEALLETLEVVGDQKHLRYIQSERRQVYEVKDMQPSKNKRVFFVSDFLLRFESQTGKSINWYFEIELTIKTKRRYKEGVFVKYINHLNKHKDAHLIYVSPSTIILEELERYKKEIEDRAVNAEDVFSRFHIFSQNEFRERLEELILDDSHINW